jgi:hypothetical protein
MVATANTPFPGTFKLPELKLPKLDLEAVFGLQKANLAVAQEAQSVLLDAAQAIVRAQHGYTREFVAQAETALKAREPKKPEAILADAQASAQKAVAVAKKGVELGVAAQRRVVDLFAKRAQANLDELKALAA